MNTSYNTRNNSIDHTYYDIIITRTIQDTEITERSEEQTLTTKTGDIVNDTHNRTPIAQVNKPSHVSSSVPAVLSSNTGPHPLPITSSLSGWEEFGAGHNAYSSELGTNSLIGDNNTTTI